MCNRLKARAIYLMVLMCLAGCTSGDYRHDGRSSVDNRQLADKERILLKTKNYQSLININRESLKKKENPEVRFKLAEYAYLAGNYDSSLHYLVVSLKNNPSPRVYLLQTKNLVAQHKYDKAQSFVNMLLQKEPSNGEGLNLRGIIQAQRGELPNALHSFEQARNAFYSEEKVVNNIALVHIADRRYARAIELLLPVYLRGYRDNQLCHNLVFALVKAGDLRYAREIIKRENLSKYPDTLVSSLFEIESNLSPL